MNNLLLVLLKTLLINTKHFKRIHTDYIIGKRGCCGDQCKIPVVFSEAVLRLGCRMLHFSSVNSSFPQSYNSRKKDQKKHVWSINKGWGDEWLKIIHSVKGIIGIRALIFEVRTRLLLNGVASHAAFSGDARLIFLGLWRSHTARNNKINGKDKRRQITPHGC